MGPRPGAPRQVEQRWTQQAVHSSVQGAFVRECRRQTLAMPSLAEYHQLHPTHSLDNFVHNRRVPFQDARVWGLARCGHHWFGDGRLARHAGLPSSCLFCHASDGSFAHALLECPGFTDLRQRWLSTRSSQAMPRNRCALIEELFADLRHNSSGQVAINCRFVAYAYRRAETAAAGLTLPDF